MATQAFAPTAAATGYRADQSFFLRMAIGMAVLVLIAFGQFAARGFVDYQAAPIWVHLHGIAMVAWISLFVVQNHLANQGSLALHRRLGWTALAVALVIVFLGTFTAVKAIELHRVPPFFTNPYFLALGPLGVLFFFCTLLGAVWMRRDTQWHRRLTLSAMTMILEPAFGRLLPMPLLGAAGPWVEAACGIGVLGIAMRHDQRVYGKVHPALLLGAGLILAHTVLVHLLAVFPPFMAFAESLAAR